MRRLIFALILAGLLAIATAVPAFAVEGPLSGQVDDVVNLCNPLMVMNGCSDATCEEAVGELVTAARPLG